MSRPRHKDKNVVINKINLKHAIMMKVKETPLTQKRSGLIDVSTKLETLKQFSD